MWVTELISDNGNRYANSSAKNKVRHKVDL